MGYRLTKRGTAHLLEATRLAREPLDCITSDAIAGYARQRLDTGLKVESDESAYLHAALAFGNGKLEAYQRA